MKITIEAEAKEIAALVKELEGRRNEGIDFAKKIDGELGEIKKSVEQHKGQACSAVSSALPATTY